MTKQIASFQGEYRFLSNFFIEPDGSCVEKEFQASKATNEEDMNLLLNAKTPGEAKRIGSRVEIREDWELIKLAVMLRLMKRKFEQEPLRTKLLNTGDAELIEGNWWGDTYWGVCQGKGENNLGKMLMCVREELRAQGGNR